MYNFAELMLPDGAHKRDEDSTIFMLRRTPLVKSSRATNHLRQVLSPHRYISLAHATDAVMKPPPPPAPRVPSTCKFTDIERAYETEHKVLTAAFASTFS